MKRQFNEKPSKFNNLGLDIPNAARHNRDTYETPEQTRKKAFKKSSSKVLTSLLNEYSEKLNIALDIKGNTRDLLKEYEFKKAILGSEHFEPLKDDAIFKNHDIKALRAVVLSEASFEKRNQMIKEFNRLLSKQRKVLFLRDKDIASYFEPKKRFKYVEHNGAQRPWDTKSESYDVKLLASQVRAIQFGNSLTDKERVYCGENMLIAIKEVSQHFVIDFKSLGFSFGARGKSGSVAHYDHTQKVLAFNRGWSGAFIHELGHALDYSLGLPSSLMPYSIQRKYKQKLLNKKFDLNTLQYLMNTKEIFARMFERYCQDKGFSPFTYTLNSESILPDFDQESLSWFESIISKVLKRLG